MNRATRYGQLLRAVRRTARRARRESGAPGAGEGGRSFARGAGPAVLAAEDRAATKVLFERLDAADVEEVERRAAEAPGLSIAGDEVTRRYLVLAYGIWLGVGAVAEKTGLSPLQPPEDVHAMARGPLAAAGGIYEADLVVDALRGAGVDLAEIHRGLDFGCSSGRVVRVMSAWRPEIEWSACDPNQAAVGWLGAKFPSIRTFVSPQHPPLPLPEGSLDLVYAISIWSHFEPQFGLRWFQEMHRLLRPGGTLVLTTHGFQSIAFYALGSLRSAEQSEEILWSMYRDGWWYRDEFGEHGDWGVVNPLWGTAFLNPEWLLDHLLPRWRVLEFASGRNSSNQDVFVLERA